VLPALGSGVAFLVGAINQMLRTRTDTFDLAESINYDDSLLDA
jgi:hypothetical protein